MSRLIAAILAAFWGFVLVGIAMWLSKDGAPPTGALACIVYSAGYFWFAWATLRGRSDEPRK